MLLKMANFKNVLFIGDLRDAGNLGAIATSSTLIENLKMRYKNVNFSFLNHGDMLKKKYNTEKKGYLKVKKILKNLKLVKLFNNLKPSNKSLNHVPNKFNDYEDFYNSPDIVKLSKEIELIKKSDLVIINGEGNFVKGIDNKGRYRIGARYLLYMIYLATFKFNKKTFLINFTFDIEGDAVKKIVLQVFSKLAKISVREKMSIQKLKSVTNLENVEFIPDALFMYKPNDEQDPKVKKFLQKINSKFIILGDSSGIRSSAGHSVKWDVVITFSKIVKCFKGKGYQVVFLDGFAGTNYEINDAIRKNKLPYLNILDFSWNQIGQILGKATCLISGRWHASILSLLHNTPIVTYSSDSHKTKAINELVDFGFNSHYNIHEIPQFIDEMVKDVCEIDKNSQIIKMKIKKEIEELNKLAFKNIEL